MKRSILLSIAGILLAGIVFITFKNTFFFKKNITNQKSIPEKTTYNFLLLGYGGGKHDGAYLTDTMMVAHINLIKKKVNLTSLPRDLWVRLPTKSGANFHTKINSLFQLELGEMGDISKVYPDIDAKYFGKLNDAEFTKYIVQQITKIPIDGYLGINFSGFTRAVDILGGVDIMVEKTFEDPEYPIDGKESELCEQEELFKKADPFLTPGFNPEERARQFKDDPKLEEFVKNATESPNLAFPCRYETLKFTKGMTHMDGKTALKFARSRHSPQDGNDFSRSHRQQLVIEAVKEKVLSLGFISKIIPLISEFKNDIKTDISLDTIQKFLKYGSRAKEFEISTFVISDQNLLKNDISTDKQYVLIPRLGIDNYSEIQEAIRFVELDITPSPTATPSGKLKK